MRYTATESFDTRTERETRWEKLKQGNYIGLIKWSDPEKIDRKWKTRWFIAYQKEEHVISGEEVKQATETIKEQ